MQIIDFLKEKKKTTLRGSQTVEAAVLIPIVFAVILFVISICMILHDRTVIGACLHETAQEKGFQKISTENSEGPAASLLISDLSQEIKNTGKRRIIICSSKEGMISPFVEGMFFLTESYFEKEEAVFLVYGEEVLRETGF